MNKIDKNVEILLQNKSNSQVSINVIPEDIFLKLSPGIQVTEARKFLGEPRKKEQGDEVENWLYPFEDGDVQLDVLKDKVIAITIEQNSNSRRQIPIEPLNRTLDINAFLGKMTFDSFRGEAGQCSTPKFQVAARSAISYTECYFGRAGNYFTYVFGTTDSGDQLVHTNQKFNYVVILEAPDLNEGNMQIYESGHCDGFSICR